MQLRTATSGHLAKVIDTEQAASWLASGRAPLQDLTDELATGPALAVVAGCHAGASFQLRDKVYRIGSTAEADIVLADPGIAPDHATIRIGRGSMTVEARGGNVDIAGHGILPSGYGRIVRLPAEIALGGARLRITDDRLPPLPRAAQRIMHLGRQIARTPLQLSCLALGTVLLLALPFVLTEWGASPANPPVSQAAGTPIPTGATAVDAAEKLRARVAAAGLASLQIATADGNRIVVTGVVPEKQMSAWSEIRSWFDATYAQNPLLVAQVSASDAVPIQNLRLRAIWFGEMPYIVTSDGRRHHEGAILEGGWRIERIDREAVTFAREGSVVRLTY
jgi:FOG: FHA domain